jgi:hypothetical protein
LKGSLRSILATLAVGLVGNRINLLFIPHLAKAKLGINLAKNRAQAEKALDRVRKVLACKLIIAICQKVLHN